MKPLSAFIRVTLSLTQRFKPFPSAADLENGSVLVACQDLKKKKDTEA